MDQYRMNQILRVAKMYYELNLSQLEIGRKEHMSKSTVSRLIQQASELGLVKISVIEPEHSFLELEQEMITHFGLRNIAILPDVVDNEEIVRKDLCVALSEDLGKYVSDNSILGLNWGSTISALQEELPTIKRKNVRVFQVNGGVAKAVYNNGVADIVQSFVTCFNGEGYLLPAPAMVDTKEIADAIKSDSSYKTIYNLANQCQTVIYSPGIMGYQSTLYQMGYFTKEAYDQLSSIAVCDIFNHFVDINGNIADPDLDSRVISVPYDTIKQVENKVVIAVGKKKAKATLGCLRAGMVNSLYIDQPTAKEIMRIEKGLEE